MKKNNYILFILFCFIAMGSKAQAQVPVKDTLKPSVAPATISTTPPLPDTSIHVHEQPIVKATVQKMYDYQRFSHGTSPGFRVQIAFGQERGAINETKAGFDEKYPGVPSYISYKQPYFRVSVGDFRTRLDAVRFLNSAHKDYPGAFIVADKIMPPPLQ